MVLRTVFHAWERRLADVTKNRVVRPFEWGLDWIPPNGNAPGTAPHEVLSAWVSHVMADTDAFFTPAPTSDYTLTGDTLAFPSAFVTPHQENNTVYCRYFPARLKPSRYEHGKHSRSATASAERETPGATASAERETRSAKALAERETRGATASAERETRSATASAERETRSAKALAERETRGTTASAERETPGATALAEQATRSATALAERRAAVLVLPQWNSDAGGHVGLCQLLARAGMSALRLSLPYHDRRMPPELQRADYIVSSNIARTVQVCRQAVLDARRAIQWLAGQGYTRIGVLGSSLGSCLALLTTAHEPLVRAQALNHISPYFADVVWRGLSTRHVRQGLDGHIDLDLLRALWSPISPQNFLERVRGRRTLLVYARYDLTFPVDLSESLVKAFRDRGIPHDVTRMRCGHYSIGKAPFEYVDGWVLTRFLRSALL